MLAPRQRDGLAGGQHMVAGVAAAGDPHPARLHLQPAVLAGLQGQRGADAQLAVGGIQHLQGRGWVRRDHGVVSGGGLVPGIRATAGIFGGLAAMVQC